MSLIESAEDSIQELPQDSLSLCSSCNSLLQKIDSIGEPSFLAELFDETFEYKDAIDNVVNTNKDCNDIHLPRKGRNVEDQTAQNKICFQNQDTNNFEILVTGMSNEEPGKRKEQASAYCDELCRGRNIDNPESISECKRIKLDNRSSFNNHHCVIPEFPHHSACSTQHLSQNVESIGKQISLIEEFRKECRHILLEERFNDNLLEKRDVPSARKQNTYDNIAFESISGAEEHNLSKKLSILDRRKNILVIANRLLSLTNDIDNIFRAANEPT